MGKSERLTSPEGVLGPVDVAVVGAGGAGGNASALEVHLLGSAQIRWPRSRASAPLTPICQQLLGYLILKRDRPHPRETIAGTFWAETTDLQAKRRLNTAVWRLRKALEPPGVPRGTYITADRRGGLAFNPDSGCWLDVEEFERAVSPMMRSETPTEEEARRAEEGLRLYRGDLLEGVYDDWVLTERARLQNLYLGALERLMRWHAERTDVARAVRFGSMILSVEPMREDVYRHLMNLYAGAGRRADALVQFERCRNVLRAELDVDPMPETIELAARISGGERTASRGPAAAPQALVAELEQTLNRLSALERSITASLAMLRGHTPR